MAIPERYKNMGFSSVGQKKESTRPGKKWMVLAKKGDQYKVVHGGYKGMKDFSQHGSEKRKDNFWNRMGGKNSSKATDPFSPLYWHKRLGTWKEGGSTLPRYQIRGEKIRGVDKRVQDAANATGPECRAFGREAAMGGYDTPNGIDYTFGAPPPPPEWLEMIKADALRGYPTDGKKREIADFDARINADYQATKAMYPELTRDQYIAARRDAERYSNTNWAPEVKSAYDAKGALLPGRDVRNYPAYQRFYQSKFPGQYKIDPNQVLGVWSGMPGGLSNYEKWVNTGYVQPKEQKQFGGSNKTKMMQQPNQASMSAGQNPEQMLIAQIIQALQSGVSAEQILEDLVQNGVPEEIALQFMEQVNQMMEGQMGQMDQQMMQAPPMAKGGSYSGTYYNNSYFNMGGNKMGSYMYDPYATFMNGGFVPKAALGMGFNQPLEEPNELDYPDYGSYAAADAGFDQMMNTEAPYENPVASYNTGYEGLEPAFGALAEEEEEDGADQTPDEASKTRLKTYLYQNRMRHDDAFLTEFAQALNIPNYSGTAEQNNKILDSLLRGAGTAGGLDAYLQELKVTRTPYRTIKRTQTAQPRTITPTIIPTGGGKNITDSTKVPCPAGFVKDANGNCVPLDVPCPPGFTKDASGNCVQSPSTDCPNGFTKDLNGNCVPAGTVDIPCPKGQVKNERGICVPADGNTGNWLGMPEWLENIALITAGPLGYAGGKRLWKGAGNLVGRQLDKLMTNRYGFTPEQLAAMKQKAAGQPVTPAAEPAKAEPKVERAPKAEPAPDTRVRPSWMEQPGAKKPIPPGLRPYTAVSNQTLIEALSQDPETARMIEEARKAGFNDSEILREPSMQPKVEQFYKDRAAANKPAESAPAAEPAAEPTKPTGRKKATPAPSKPRTGNASNLRPAVSNAQLESAFETGYKALDFQGQKYIDALVEEGVKNGLTEQQARRAIASSGDLSKELGEAQSRVGSRKAVWESETSLERIKRRAKATGRSLKETFKRFKEGVRKAEYGGSMNYGGAYIPDYEMAYGGACYQCGGSYADGGGFDNPGFEALPDYVQEKIMRASGKAMYGMGMEYGGGLTQYQIRGEVTENMLPSLRIISEDTSDAGRMRALEKFKRAMNDTTLGRDIFPPPSYSQRALAENLSRMQAQQAMDQMNQMNKNFYVDPKTGRIVMKQKKGGININPANKGKFTAKAKSAGMGVQEYARKVMSAPEGRYPAATRRQANFARNAAGWKRQEGGIVGQEMEVTPDQLQMLRDGGYEFKILR